MALTETQKQKAIEYARNLAFQMMINPDITSWPEITGLSDEENEEAINEFRCLIKRINDELEQLVASRRASFHLVKN